MPPRRKRAPARKTAARAAQRPSKPQPTAPVAGPGEQFFVLAVPFEERGVATANGARWDPFTRQTIFVGANLPYGLTPYASQDHSWERWVEDDLNRKIRPTTSSSLTLTPRAHQVEAINKIERSAALGYRGFVEADDVGLGKTISAWEGAMRVAKTRGARNVLVMCPKGVIPHWRRTIAAMGDHGLRVVVINYDQAKKLLSVPESAASASRTRTKNKRIADSGKPLVAWDIVLYDESHKTKNPTSQRSKAAARIARYSEAAQSAPFVIWMSATIGQAPHELAYLSPLFAQLTGATKSALKDFGGWLDEQGFCVTYNDRYKKWEWGVIPEDASLAEKARIEAAKEADLARIRQILFDGPDAPSIRRLPTNIAGWPEIQRILYPIDLDFEQRRLYEQAWTAFRADMNLYARGKDPKGGRAASLRFRQKASLIRVPGTVEHVLDLIENGHQVAVSVEFHESSDALRDGLEAANVAVAEFSGRNSDVREQERLAFQRGERQVMLFSVTEGISLHQREKLPDGSLATDVPRSTVSHDPRFSGLEAIQVEGRCHRDGQNANVYYMFAAGTVEERIIRRVVSRVRSTKTMSGDDVAAVAELEALLEASAVGESSRPSPGLGSQSTHGGERDPVPSASGNQGQPPTALPGGPPPVSPRRSGTAKAVSAAPRAVAAESSRQPNIRRVTRPVVPGSDGEMSAEERALRKALSGGKRAARQRRTSPEEAELLKNRMRNG